MLCNRNWFTCKEKLSNLLAKESKVWERQR